MKHVKSLVWHLVLNFFLSAKRFSLVDELTSAIPPVISCVVPVYNQQLVIKHHLLSLIDNAINPIELIVINDASTDESENEVLSLIDTLRKTSIPFHSVKLYSTRIPMYETRCEDFAFRVATGKYLMSLQADMKILHKNFDAQLINTLENYPDLAAISCRGTHRFLDLNLAEVMRGRESSDGIGLAYFLRFFNRIKFKLLFIVSNFSSRNETKDIINESRDEESHKLLPLEFKKIFPDSNEDVAGWLGSKIQLLPYEFDQVFFELIDSLRSRVWFSETIMRGPLFFKKSIYVEVGGFNTRAFYQGLDDHDFSTRIMSLGKKVGFTPIYFSSPLHLGSARKQKKFKERLISEIHVHARKPWFDKSGLIVNLKERLDLG